MKTIWKYPVQPQMTLSLPKDAEILTVQVQGSTPMVWALVDPHAPRIERQFEAYGTGHDIPELLTKADYLGTFQVEGGLIFHLFEV